LDAARVLIAKGYHADNWLEGWRPGSTAFALRARLGIAAGFTVDETKTVFAKWKPFSSSAVASGIDYSEEGATTQASATSALLQPPPEEHSKQTLGTAPSTARSASSSADEYSTGDNLRARCAARDLPTRSAKITDQPIENTGSGK
jgi:hypothetical protein